MGEEEQLVEKIKPHATNGLMGKSADNLLKEVLNYRYGEGKYDLSHLKDDLRENEMFDLWQDLEQRIKEYLDT